MSDADPILAGKTVLVLDDEPMLAFALHDLLHLHGARVLNPCTSIDEAMDVIDSEERIDGALLDIQIGDREVWPVAERLKERGVPVIFVSAVCDTHPIPAAFDAAPRVVKPVDDMHLRQTMSANFR